MKILLKVFVENDGKISIGGISHTEDGIDDLIRLLVQILDNEKQPFTSGWVKEF